MTPRVRSATVLVALAVLPACERLRPSVQPTIDPRSAPVRELWENPGDVSGQDLFYGSWGKKNAPDPHATFAFRAAKTHGSNPGMTIEDEQGRVWPVKNTLYDVKKPGAGPEHWYVVRDLGTAVGTTGRIRPKRNNIESGRSLHRTAA